jgi:hypothetical protein
MEVARPQSLKHRLWSWPWAVLRFFGRLVRRFFVALGVLAALIIAGYFGWRRSSRRSTSTTPTRSTRAWTSTESTIARLHDRAYFAQQSTLVTEDLKTVACISSPEHRTLINDAEDIPPLFVSAILASEDKNFFTHQGIDKMAILRALGKRILGESRSGASTLTMQIAKHLRGGTGRTSTELEKVGDIVMALRIEREFPRQELLVKYVNMPYFGRGQYGIEAASRAYFGKPAKELTLPEVAFVVALINKPGTARSRVRDRPDAARARADSRRELGRRARAARPASWTSCSTKGSSTRSSTHGRQVSSTARSARLSCLRPRAAARTTTSSSACASSTRTGFRSTRAASRSRSRATTRCRMSSDAGGRADAAHYLARHPERCGQRSVARRRVRRRLLGRRPRRVGNVNFRQWKYDVIATGWRQPGSTFKIFTYGGLVERLDERGARGQPQARHGEIAARVLERCTVLDAPIFVSLGRGRGSKKIENFHSRSEPEYRGEISCRIALGESRNTAAMRAGARAGIKNVIELTYRLGMPKDAKHPLQPYPTTAIGASEVNPLAMASTALRERRISRHARLRERRLPRGKSLLETEAQARRMRHPRAKAHPPGARDAPRRFGGDDRALKGPLDIGPREPRLRLRAGVIPGWTPERRDLEMKPDERRSACSRFRSIRRARSPARPARDQCRRKTSDVGCCCSSRAAAIRRRHRARFWMGKDSKDHPLGERGSTGGPGFAESGARNWVHSAATVLAFLQKERGLLQPETRFGRCSATTSTTASRSANRSRREPSRPMTRSIRSPAPSAARDRRRTAAIEVPFEVPPGLPGTGTRCPLSETAPAGHPVEQFLLIVDQSTVAPVAFAIFPHWTASALTNAAKLSGVSPTNSEPVSSSTC